MEQLRNRFPESEECWLKESQVCRLLISLLRKVHAQLTFRADQGFLQLLQKGSGVFSDIQHQCCSCRLGRDGQWWRRCHARGYTDSRLWRKCGGCHIGLVSQSSLSFCFLLNFALKWLGFFKNIQYTTHYIQISNKSPFCLLDLH